MKVFTAYMGYVALQLMCGLAVLTAFDCAHHPINTPPVVQADCEAACTHVQTCPFASECLANCEAANDPALAACIGAAGTCEQASACDK